MLYNTARASLLGMPELLALSVKIKARPAGVKCCSTTSQIAWFLAGHASMRARAGRRE
jgi:hypothetical protein